MKHKEGAPIVISLLFIIASILSGCTQPPVACGNGMIDVGETCLNCPQDVGNCPASDNITCYQCQDGVILEEKFSGNKCPPNWQNNKPGCSKIRCYQCQNGVQVTQDFLGSTCPSGWYSTQQTCSVPSIICYQCQDGAEKSQTVTGTTCPSGWYPTHQDCTPLTVTCYQCQGTTEITDTFSGIICPSGWYPSHQNCGGNTQADYYVATNGNDASVGDISHPFRTIQHAVDVATAGKTIYINPGTYNEIITMKNSGTASNPIVVAGGTTKPIISGAGKTGGTNTGIIFLNDKKYITFNNLKIQNSDCYGIFTKWRATSNPSTDITISNCDFYHIKYYAVQFVNENTIMHYRMKVTRCTFDDIEWGRNGEECVGFGLCQDSEFSYNKMTRLGKIGVDFGRCINCVCHHNDIDNTDASTESYAIYVIAGNTAVSGFSQGVHIYDNYIHGNRQLIGVANERAGVTIKDVLIENNILIEAGSYKAIYQFVSNGDSYYDNIKIIHNTIVTNGGSAIQMDAGSSYAKNLVIANNICYGGIIYIASSNKVVTNNLNTNPLFMNTGLGAEKYHLQSGSPANNAGSITYRTPYDYDGNPRGSPPDIGAYEY